MAARQPGKESGRGVVFRSFPTADNCCPRCGHKLNSAFSSCTEEAPGPDDAALCIKCGQAMVFNGDMTVRAMTEEELDQLSLEVKMEIARALEAIRHVNAKLN